MSGRPFPWGDWTFMIFGRVKPLDAILATAEKKGLQRSLGAFQLTMLGIGAVIGTGIFVLTSEAAQKAGPGMMLSFVLAGFVCAVAALCYSELASMVPVAGSAYTYTYAVMGELLAWMVGWALILEYAVGASAVAVGWSGYVVGQIRNLLGIDIPMEWVNGPSSGGYINLPAVIISLLVTWLLVVGTTESARVNAILVAIKVAALTLFIALSVPVMNGANFHPFMPTGLTGVAGAAASIFFAYVGFDAVSTAAEETKNPQRNVPIGLIASLLFCTVFYLLVSAGAIGSPLGAQPVRDAAGVVLSPGTSELTARCQAIVAGGAAEPLSCSKEALAHVLRTIGWEKIGNLIGLAATLALPSVVLMMMFGQTRVFFTMARDGLLPQSLAVVSKRSGAPTRITLVTGVSIAIVAGIFRLDEIAELANAGTLLAFIAVGACLMILRRRAPEAKRLFRCPQPYLVGTLAILGCLYLLFSLPSATIVRFIIWNLAGLAFYFAYGRRRSALARG